MRWLRRSPCLKTLDTVCRDEARLLVEFSRRRERETSFLHKLKSRRTVTIYREFGCEAYPVAECLRQTTEKKSGATWLLFDKGLLDEIARNNDLIYMPLLPMFFQCLCSGSHANGPTYRRQLMKRREIPAGGAEIPHKRRLPPVPGGQVQIQAPSRVRRPAAKKRWPVEEPAHPAN